MNIDLNTSGAVSQPSTDADYPSAGLPTTSSSSTASIPVGQPSVSTANLGSSSSVSFIQANFPRVNSFSTAKLANNSAMIAVASQDEALLTLPPTNDPVELQRREAARVYVLSSAIDDKYASAVRIATVTSTVPVGTSSTSTGGNQCYAVPGFLIQVDSDLTFDNTLTTLWVLDGPFAGVSLGIVQRYTSNTWKVQSNSPINPQPGDCFKFVAYGNSTYSSPVSLASLSPLPYITTNEGIVPSINPQIAAWADAAPSSPKYVYIVAEAPVNGIYQLFFYSMKIGILFSDSETFGWQQLTFDGENKNAKIKVDRNGNLHVVWESSRCQPNQIYYGVMGPGSRLLNNNIFASVVDKQIATAPTTVEGDWNAEPDPFGNVSWLSNQVALPAGTYRITYLGGGINNGGLWYAKASVITSNGFSTTVVTNFNTTSLGFTTLAACESSNLGATLDFTHNGGPLGVLFPANSYGGDIFSDADPLLFDIKLIAMTSQPNGLGFSLLEITNPASLNLRQIDEYGAPYGDFYTPLIGNSGNVNITNDQSFTVVGNPSTQKYAAIATLARDENDDYFTPSFAQLSYQSSFDLIITGFSDFYDQVDIQEEIVAFKQRFSPVAGDENENLYTQTGTTYSIDDPQICFESIIPIMGAYKAPGYTNSSGATNTPFSLHHYMLVAMPQKLRLVARATNNMPDIIEEILTGYFKLGLVMVTPSNLGDRSSNSQKFHWVRTFGQLYQFGQSQNFKIAVHYSHQSLESETFVAEKMTDQNDSSLVRFNADILIAVNETPVLGETFVADFSDNYVEFDLGFGCVMVGEIRTLTLSAYDNSVNENISVGMHFQNVCVGPHSVLANTYLTDFSSSDRNVDTMFVPSIVDSSTSLTSAQQASISQDLYQLTLGLVVGKYGLTQMPITLLGGNTTPSLDIDRCGCPHVAFQSLRDGRWEIYYTGSFDPSMPFRFDTRLSNSDSMSLCPTIAVDSKGRRLVAWHDDRNGPYQIYVARSATVYDCENDLCNRDYTEDYGTDEYLAYDEYDPYIYEDSRIGGYNSIKFTFQNVQSTTGKYHFRVNLFSDENLTSYVKEIDSRLSIANWSINGVQMPYDGFTVAPGETVDVEYVPSSDDELDGLFYCEIESDDGTTLLPLDGVLVFASGSQDTPSGSLPVVYTNSTNAPVNVNFRITVYRDQAMTQAVMSVGTQDSVTKWVKGQMAFTSGGISVKGGQTISVVYNPEILPQELSVTRNQSAPKALFCGVKYWITVESIISMMTNVIDTYAFECPCDGIRTDNWREPREYNDWVCSGLGNLDIQLSKTDSHALFPNAAASADGFVYVTWEDRRLAINEFVNNHYIYFALWDATTDKFYSSAQGFRDREVTTYSRYRPLVIVNNTMHPAFIYTDGISVFVKIESLYQAASQSSSSSSSVQNGLYPQGTIPISYNESFKCMYLRVYEPDISELYQADSTAPIALVDDCLVRLEVKSTDNAYAVRLRNENDNQWSDWISVLPPLARVSSSSSAIEYEQSIAAYAVGTDRAIVPWVLSGGNGTKTVYCQALTPAGITPQFSGNIIARYAELQYTIDFYRDNLYTTAAGTYQGTPVIGLQQVTVNANDATSLLSSTSSTNKVFFKVTFSDADRLSRTLALLQTSQFAASPQLTFDVYTQGFNSLGNLLSSTSNGFYAGSFNIGQQDGLDFKDGLGFVQVNVPSPCLSVSSSSNGCSTLLTPQQIQARMVAELQNSEVDFDQFKLKYTPDILCSFISAACVDGTPPPYVGPIGDGDPVTSTGPVTCDLINWVSPQLGEVGFYKNNTGPNSTTWAVISQVFELDFSDPRTDYVKFNTTSTHVDDVLLMIPAGASVSTLPSSSSSVYSSVQFALPQGTIVFAATDGHYCDKPQNCSQGSVQKTFTIGGVPIGTIPLGSTFNDGTGNYSVFAVPFAQGINYTPSSSSSLSPTLALKTDITTSVSKKELMDRGYITTNGVLSFKLVHIISGVGFAYVYGLTCGASCFFASSSSSSNLDS
jgi:hypothetical protein